MPELGTSGSAGGPGWTTAQVYPTGGLPGVWLPGTGAQRAIGAMIPAEVRPSKTSCTAMAPIEADDLFGDQHVALVDLVAHFVRPAKDRHIEQQDKPEHDDRYDKGASDSASATAPAPGCPRRRGRRRAARTTLARPGLLHDLADRSLPPRTSRSTIIGVSSPSSAAP